jgi:membrane associated rhomboid family serine protease
MVKDEAFCASLIKNRIITKDSPQFRQWRKKRDAYESLKQKALTYRFGYRPREKNTVGLFTCMYLHGSVMHLVGNMVFLWLFGAFLEAAVGSIWFFVLYSIAGVISSSLFGMMYPFSSGPLIGASGAISGLMGAYGIVFGVRKIRVFYSLGFYFNYARIPAIVLFPFWLGTEFFMLWTDKQSHVAYMAHIGGLIAGIMMGAGIRFRKKEQIDSLFYQEQQESKIELLLNSAMDKFIDLDFVNARIEFNKLLALDPENMKALKQMFIIDKSTPQREEFHQSAHRLLKKLRRIDPEEYLAVFEEYRTCAGKPRVTVEMLEQLSHLYLNAGNLKQAAACIATLIKRESANGKIPGFLYSLAVRYQKSNREEEARKCYRILASKFPASHESEEAKKYLKGFRAAPADRRVPAASV